MKNMRKFLALSLLLSIPSMKYAMENNVGQQVGESMASNIGNTMEIGGSVTNSGADAAGKASENVANQVVENTAGQSWFSNPMTWNRPSMPSMPDLGLQGRLSAFNEGYVAPAMQGIDSRLQAAGSYLNENAGKPVWNATTGMYESYVAPVVQGAGSRLAGLNENYVMPGIQKVGSGLQAAGSYLNEKAVQPGYELGARGWNSGGQMVNNAGEFLRNNPEYAGLGLMAAALGAWFLYQLNNPSLANSTVQKDIDRLVEDFKAKNADQIAKKQAAEQAPVGIVTVAPVRDEEAGIETRSTAEDLSTNVE